MIAQLAAQFLSPPAEYRPMMFWVWNGEVTRERIDRDIAEMKDKGCGGFFIHPMGESFRLNDFIEGQSPPYLSDEYFEVVQYTVERAAEEGLYAWLYDEGGWPSGSAQGHVVDGHPELAGKVLSVVPGDEPKPEGTVATVALREGLEPLVISPESTRRPEPDASAVHIVAQRGGFAVDLMDPGAVARFIEVTHERYRECVGEHFGKTVPGMFTDESPVGGRVGTNRVPWTPRMLQAFQEDHGVNLQPLLPLLFSDEALGFDPREHYGEEQLAAVRLAYADTWTRLYKEAYWDQINAWCDENGLLHVGHVGGEDSLQDHRNHGFGEFFRTAGTLDVPGVDAIWRQLWHGKVNPHYPLFASSAAHQKAPSPRGDAWPKTGLALTESFGVYGFGLSFADMKWVTDYQFVRGINIMCPMALSMYTEGGRLYRTMDYMGPGNPLWEHYGGYADYVGRLSVVGRAGQSMASVAVYYPVETLWADEPGVTAGSFEALCGLLEDQQVEFDLMGGDALLAADVGEEVLATPGAEYDLVIVPEMAVARTSVLRKLGAFRHAGGRIVFLGDGPQWAIEGCAARPVSEAAPDLLARAFDVRLPKDQDRLVDAFGGSSARTHVQEFDGFSAAYKPGGWLRRFEGRRLSPGTALTVSEQDLAPFAQILGGAAGRVRLSPVRRLEGVRLMTRAVGETTLHLLVNERDEEVACELLLASETPLRLEAWDPDTGKRHVLADHEEVTEATEVDLTLGPFGSVVLVALPPEYLPEPEGSDLPEPDSRGKLTGRPILEGPVSGWEIVGGHVAPAESPPPELGAEHRESDLGWWTDIEGWEHFSGTAQYRYDLVMPGRWEGHRLVLELTEVRYVAEMWVNGKPAGKQLWAPYEFDVTGLLAPGDNELVIHVTNTLANQALKPEAVEEAKANGWWNTYRERSQSMMEENLRSGMAPEVVVWLGEE